MRAVSNARLWHRYLTAKAAKAEWTAEEKHAKAELLLDLGYDTEDKKPPSDEIADADGERIGVVKVGQGTRLDVAYFKAQYPDIYAECEKTSYSVSIQADA